MERQKRVIAIHDISAMGRCSLTVALPVISAAGAEVNIIPTALLSTHTGGFENYTFSDLSSEMEKIAAHWQTLNRKTDAIYTGYLGSPQQIDTVCNIIDMLADKNTLIFTDPVMGDNGKLYSAFNEDYPEKIKKLCKRSDVITPNLTEACLLSGVPYRQGQHDEEYISSVLDGLKPLGAKMIYLTGITPKKDYLGVACFDTEKNEKHFFLTPHIEGMYHGAGDLFASALLGAILKKHDNEKAVSLALEFTSKCIVRTHETKEDTRYGLCFEPLLSEYIKSLE